MNKCIRLFNLVDMDINRKRCRYGIGSAVPVP